MKEVIVMDTGYLTTGGLCSGLPSHAIWGNSPKLPSGTALVLTRFTRNRRLSPEGQEKSGNGESCATAL
ncbi:MAG TPA: hypothetical protein VNQ76_00930 [Planctomicrobium sp.]|nr:hypothetical protein [Planctomicrobium sp.]